MAKPGKMLGAALALCLLAACSALSPLDGKSPIATPRSSPVRPTSPGSAWHVVIPCFPDALYLGIGLPGPDMPFALVDSMGLRQ